MTDTVDLKSQEVQDAIAAAVEAAVDGLKTKNTELLGKLKKAQQGQQIDPADLASVEAERDTLKQQLNEATKAAKKLAAENDAAAKKLADAEGFTQRLLVDNGLSEALAKAGVTNPVHIKAAKAMLASQVQIADDNGNKVARMGEKALADAIAEWAGTDEGKYFVAATNTAGDGAQGSHRVNTNQKSVTRSEFNQMNPSDQAAHFKAGGEVVDS